MQTMTLKHQWHFFFNHHHIKMKIKSKQKPPMPPRHRQIEQQLSPSLPYKIHYRLIKLSEYEKLFPPTGIHKTGELHFGRRKVTEPSPGIPAGACLNFFLASITCWLALYFTTLSWKVLDKGSRFPLL